MEYQLVVIGGGTAGYMVALGAAKLGAKVAVIEKSESFGGIALKYGCIPTKALLNITKNFKNLGKLNEAGLSIYCNNVDLRKLNGYVHSIANQLSHNTSAFELKKYGVDIFYGSAHFTKENVISVGSKLITAKNFVLATGARPIIPNIKNINQISFVTYETIFDLITLPTKLIVLGSNFHALEFAQVFSRLGTKVYVVEKSERILPNISPDISWEIRRNLEEEGIIFCTGINVDDCYMQKSKVYLSCVDAEGHGFTLFADQLLVNTGIRANVEGLGLANAKVKFNQYGIVVDQKMRTTNKHIYAIGDVVYGSVKSNQAAQYEANALLKELMFKRSDKISYKFFPKVMYTSPGYAEVGLSEHEAMLKYVSDLKNIKILRSDFSEIDGAYVGDHKQGFLKLILYKEKVIGASIVGDMAAELIVEWSFVIHTNSPLSIVADVPRSYPSVSIINKRVASSQIYKNIFTSKSKHVIQWVQKIFV